MRPGVQSVIRGELAALAAALPERSSLVPRFRRPHIVFVVLSAVVLAGAAIGTLLGGRNPGGPAHQTAASPGQIAPPADQAPARRPATPADIAAITKAMADCDAAAAGEPDSLYFLVLPLVPLDPGDQDWRAVALQTIGNSYLLSAKEALDGLRNQKLAVRPGRYTFSVLDSGTGATYSWTSATAMSRLARRDSGALKTLKLGFDFSPAQTGAQWSAEFKRDAGSCYWVSVLVRE